MKLEKKHWYWIAVGVTVLAIIGGVIIVKRRKAKKNAEEDAKKLEESNETKSEVQKEKDATPPPITPPSTFPLKKGSKGYEVKVLQKYMNSTCKASIDKAGEYPMDIDGDWGSKTEKAAIACTSVKRNSIDESFYNRIYRDMSAAKILPNK